MKTSSRHPTLNGCCAFRDRSMVVESAFISATGEVRIRHRTGCGPCAPACEAVSPSAAARPRAPKPPPLLCLLSLH